MDSTLRRRMLDYYNERAPEYEEAYTRGTGTASIPDPNVFKADVPALASIVERFAHGRIIDLACGTAYWLPYYASGCSRITLFDQSERMLEEAGRKIADIGIADRCAFRQGDFFDHEFEREAYDCALVGFFLSHLTEAQEPLLFDALKTMLAPSGRFLVLDSAWSAERAKCNAKVEHQKRQLNDGTIFEIYKRYCDRADIAEWTKKYSVTVRIEHFDAAFVAVSGSFA